MQYELRLMDTQAGVGCFEAQPKPNLSLNEMLDHLRHSPLDDFMHHFVLQRMGKLPNRKIKQFIKDVTTGQRQDDHTLAALLYEACLVHMRLQSFLPQVQALDLETLKRFTPAVNLRSHQLEDQNLHRAWIKHFAAHNIDNRPLPHPDKAGLDFPYTKSEIAPLSSPVHIADVLKEIQGSLPPANPRCPIEETTAKAAKVLEQAKAPLAPELAHKASLSPFGLLRHWTASMSVSLGQNKHSFQGLQTCYGRGMNMDQARVSMLMEMAERFSSYASFSKNSLLGRKEPRPLRYGSMQEVTSDMAALPLDKIRFEVPYEGQKLHWMQGEQPDKEGSLTPVLIPAQLVFLFCNLDEPSLFSALGSTGLASGNTMAEAKVSALCEVIERDAIAVNPLDMSRCFTIETDDPMLSQLLADYKKSNINVWFQDLSDTLGIPCYRSFVVGEPGDLNPATGCGLNATRAIVSAMTETPYPFPGPATRPVPEGLPVRKLEDLPDYCTGSAKGDLMLLETTLLRNGFTPAYADITRKDLDIPVVRAIIPGLEIMYDFDQYSRISPRLFANYLKLFK